jgi:hypothetical protein
MKRIIFIITLICAMLFSVTGCVKNTSPHGAYVYVTIDASFIEKGVLLSEYEVSLKEGTTVFDITFAACKDNGILLSSRGTGAIRYVEGIADLYEFDHGPARWVFYVNDDLHPKAAEFMKYKKEMKSGGNT